MVQKHGLVTLKQEPVLNLSDGGFLDFGLLVFLCDRLVQILVLGLIGLARGYDRNVLLVIGVLGELNFLDDFLVLEIDLIHFLGHFKLVF